MAAQRGQAFLRDDGDENGPEIGPQVAENDLGRDGDRWAAVERRLDRADRARQESEARMGQMMAQMMSIRLRTVGFSMNHPITCSDYWGPIAEEVLLKEGHPYETWNVEKLKQFRPEKVNVQVNRFA